MCLDPKEVKVFVEMMSIAAGENDYEVDRVTCFEASCIAFSQVIFSLNEQSGFRELYDACKHVSEQLGNDKNVITKLVCISSLTLFSFCLKFAIYLLKILNEN